MKLHLGCGKRRLVGFTHIDLSGHEHLDWVHDIRSLPMIKDATVDLIYCSHAFMYFSRTEAREVLKEWGRVLKTGGILRLAVPDFEALARLYLKTGALAKVIGPLYSSWSIDTSRPGDDSPVRPKTAYDFGSLRGVLEQAGFKNVRRWCWREVFVGEHAGFDDYSQSYIPHMDKENGVLTSLNVEAER